MDRGFFYARYWRFTSKESTNTTILRNTERSVQEIQAVSPPDSYPYF